MEVSYKRSMSCSYLVLQEPDEEFQNTYQTHILLENQIVGLCSCKIQKIDGKEFFIMKLQGGRPCVIYLKIKSLRERIWRNCFWRLSG